MQLDAEERVANPLGPVAPPHFDEAGFDAANPDFLKSNYIYGWSETGHSWDELVDLVTSDALHKMVRSYRVAVVYAKWHSWCERFYESVEDYIKVDVFGYQAALGPSNRHVALPPLPDRGRPAPILRKNNFPYFIPDDAEHLLLWNTSKLSLDAIISYLSVALPKERYELLLFENSSARRTIPGVYHVHCFARKKTPDSTSGIYARWSRSFEAGGHAWNLK